MHDARAVVRLSGWTDGLVGLATGVTVEIGGAGIRDGAGPAAVAVVLVYETHCTGDWDIVEWGLVVRSVECGYEVMGE